MLTKTMVQPSFWVSDEIKIAQVRGCNLFKFSDRLQSRLDQLNTAKKEETLSADQEAELAGILELDQIFTLLNAHVIAESQC